jgi:hypothetical protein
MQPFKFCNKRQPIAAALVAALVGAGTLHAGTEDGPKIPVDFQQGYLSNAMLVTKEPNSTELITGTHHLREPSWLRALQARQLAAIPRRHGFR